MEKSKFNSLIKRIVTTIVLVPVVVGCIMYGNPSIFLLALLGAALLSWEWADMVPSKRPSFYAITYLLVTAAAIFIEPVLAAVIAGILALALAYLKSSKEKWRWFLLLGIPYISIGIGSIIGIYTLYGPKMVLWFMFLVWAVDIGGYVFGCSIKGPKLAPKISPNKTWAGLIGGMVLAVAVSYAVCWYFDVEDWRVMRGYMIMAALLAIIAQIGDLIESYIKRRLGLKDSSNLIPGHGGIFDRIDGLIFAAPFACMMLQNMNVFYELGSY